MRSPVQSRVSLQFQKTSYRGLFLCVVGVNCAYNMNHDNIDFNKTDVGTLFKKMFIPTFIGMICLSVMTTIDGAFVGQGIGSDALAAVNIFCPLWMLVSGIGLMLGIGCSVVASIHFSRGNTKAANINLSQAIFFGILISSVLVTLVNIFDVETARLLGASDQLLPYVLDYQKWMSFGFIAIFITCAGQLIIRLDGSPKYAMLSSSLPSIINVILDYVFLFILDMGLEGISIATMIGCWSGAILDISYFIFFRKKIRIYCIKINLRSIKYSLKSICYQSRIGVAALLGDLCIGILMFIGNYAFLKYLGEDGVAAFSVACYIFPFVFMTGSAIAQSAQPIISFNYGINHYKRISSTLKLMIKTSVILGIIITLLLLIFNKSIISFFLSPDCNAYQLAIKGMPYVSIGFIPYILNIAFIGYYQSIERAYSATLFSLLRSCIALIPCFLLLPKLTGEVGIWIAMPLTEIITLVVIYFHKKEIKPIY